MYLESNCWTYLLGTKLPPKPSLSGSQTLHSFQFRDTMPVAMEELVDELGAAFDARYPIEQMQMMLEKTIVSMFFWISRIAAALTDSDATEEQKNEAAARFVKMKTIILCLHT